MKCVKWWFSFKILRFDFICVIFLSFFLEKEMGYKYKYLEIFKWNKICILVFGRKVCFFLFIKIIELNFILIFF